MSGAPGLEGQVTILDTLLNESMLGALYRVWTQSAVFALLRRCHARVVSALRQSAILGFVFGESAAERAFADCFAARLLRGITAWLTGLCARIAAGIRGSAICGAVMPLVADSAILNFDFLFGAFLGALFLVPHAYWNNSLFVLGAAAFTGLFRLLGGAGKRRVEDPGILGFWFFLFALSCGLSMLNTAAFSDSLRILTFFLASFAVCWIIAQNFARPDSLRRLLAFLYVSVLIMSVLGIGQRVLNLVSFNASYTDPNINVGVPGRVYATLDNPNNLSGVMQVFLPLCAAFAGGADRTWKRFVLGGALLLPVVALVMTYSRSGWISIALAAGVFVYCCCKRLIPAFAVLAAACVPFLPQSVITRFSTIFNSKDLSRNHRIDIWTGCLQMLKRYWVTGIGLGPDAFQKIYADYAYGTGKVGAYHTQMLYMELLVETGIVGFVAFFRMLLCYAGRFGRAIRRASSSMPRLVLIAGIASMTGLAASFLVEYLWYYPRCMFAFFIFFGVVLAALRCVETEELPRAAQGAD